MNDSIFDFRFAICDLAALHRGNARGSRYGHQFLYFPLFVFSFLHGPERRRLFFKSQIR